MIIKGIQQFTERYAQDINEETFLGFPMESIVRAEEKLTASNVRSIAYFSMEFGLAPSIYHSFQTSLPTSSANMFTGHRVFSNLRAMDRYHQIYIDKVLDIPIYSGGLGVLAGDTIKAAADLGFSVAGIGILWTKGYFKQSFWFDLGQMPDELRWDPYTYPGLIPLENTIAIKFEENESIYLRLWKYYVYSCDKQNVVPLILLDSNIEENGPADDIRRRLTDQLYRSDNAWWKIIQRTILGIGGMIALKELGYSINLYHLNEGHAALAYVENAKDVPKENREELKTHFAYTCHTPVEAGHDRFALNELENILDDEHMTILKEEGLDKNHKHLVNLTQLAMNTSASINAVAKKHGEITRLQFPTYADKIKTITNGVHTFTWISEPVEVLLDRYAHTIGEWRKDPSLLRNVSNLRHDREFRSALWQAHCANKRELAEILKSWFFDENVFTIAWARRIANYKRPSLILQDVDRLLKIAREVGPLQIIFAGKAHPNDNLGFTFINTMLERIDSLADYRDVIKIFMLENYDTYFGHLLTSSVDVWLNNPLPPFEASGTSGMKAILNGVIQVSTLDGWVVEAHEKHIGRIFGYVPPEGVIGTENDLHLEDDSKKLYETLEEVVKLYYDSFHRGEVRLDSEWIDMMINCISASGYFSTHRMVKEYNDMIWKLS
ncbi:MAG: alpha-glucan family phosphorylase [Candidatus Omnitrophica bacterium]|nr:alpha-glucan family phosphorylase [Candidatus Omnitrophota bacterium]